MAIKIWNEEHRVTLREMVGAATDAELTSFDWLMKEAGRLGLPAKNANALAFAMERATMNTPVFTRAATALGILKSRARSEWLDKKRQEKDAKKASKSERRAVQAGMSKVDSRQQMLPHTSETAPSAPSVPAASDMLQTPARTSTARQPKPNFSARAVFRGHIVLSTPPKGYSPYADWSERMGVERANSVPLPDSIPVVYVRTDGHPAKYVEDKAMEAWIKFRDSDPKTLAHRIAGLHAQGDVKVIGALREKLNSPVAQATQPSRRAKHSRETKVTTFKGREVLEQAPEGYSWISDWTERLGRGFKPNGQPHAIHLPESINYVWVRSPNSAPPQKYVHSESMEQWCQFRDTDPATLPFRIQSLRAQGRHDIADKLAKNLGVKPSPFAPKTVASPRPAPSTAAPVKTAAQVSALPATVPAAPPVTVPAAPPSPSLRKIKSAASTSFNRNVSVGSVASDMIRSGRLSPEQSFDMVQEMIASGQVSAAEGLTLIRECLAKKAT